MRPYRFLENLDDGQTANSRPEGMRAAAFMPCPPALCAMLGGVQAAWHQQVYQAALAQAQAATERPSLFERDWLGVWN
jgi:hypothetical protein